ncbi:MAG: hypothetical protein KKF12_05050 [Proteobacteria bacterium]|nr:hypothetical protein [Desulfobacula sp.]MBU3951591.1 hypothetical protein [Pseudomonadota bacterium]MBU4130167.1 hypothetical protein [Pseudomonadota bacterium]
MKTLFKRFFFLFFVSVLLLPIAFAILAIERYPHVLPKTSLSQNNIQQVKDIIREHRFDKNTKSPGKTMPLSETDLSLLLEYGVSKGMGIQSFVSRVKLSPGLLTATVTLKIPENFLGNYINLSVMVKERGGLLGIYAIKIGRILIPEAIAKPLLAGLHQFFLHLGPYENLYKTRKGIKQIFINGTPPMLRYELTPMAAENLKTQIKKELIPPDHQARLVRYHNELARLSQQALGRPTPLVALLQPMFAFASGQSELFGTPVQENKALFQVLALWVTGQRLEAVIDPALEDKIAALTPTKLLLRNREDLAQHFLVSAALTVSTSGRLASFIGLAKEVDDAKNGSGFSFSDLAADKAGVKIGEMAIAGQNRARQLQQRMQLVLLEDAFMPEIAYLPAPIMALEFKTRYQDMDSVSYNLVTSEIERRLENCFVFQN